MAKNQSGAKAQPTGSVAPLDVPDDGAEVSPIHRIPLTAISEEFGVHFGACAECGLTEDAFHWIRTGLDQYDKELAHPTHHKFVAIREAVAS